VANDKKRIGLSDSVIRKELACLRCEEINMKKGKWHLRGSIYFEKGLFSLKIGEQSSKREAKKRVKI
jgi:hypothetical protein